MSNNNFDLNDIVYANKTSKITLKTKEKFDELVAQVALWDSENSPMSDKENKLKDYGKPPIPSNRRILGLANFANPGYSSGRKSLLNLKSSVKAKAAFYEALNSNDKKSTPKSIKNLEFPDIFKTPKSENLIYSINEENSKLPKPEKEVFNEEFEESLPLPPPPIVDDNSLIPEKLNKSWEAKDFDSEGDTSYDLTRVSSLESSIGMGSFYDEMVDELQKLSHKDTESLPELSCVKPSKIRRSLSFSDNVKYIEASSEDDPIEIVHDSIEDVRSYSNTAQDSLVGELMQKSSSLIDELKEFSSGPEYKPGCIEHLNKCLDIVRNNLKYASVAESAYYKPVSCNEISGEVNLDNLMLSVRDDYVVINYKSLIKRGHSRKMNRLSVMFHAVLMGRSEAGTVIYESNLYSFVKRCEADKLGLESQDTRWLKLLQHARFSALRPEFKIILELYCMALHPRKAPITGKGTPKRRTPLKKLFVDSPAQNIDSPVIFTNIGTFRLFQSDMTADNDDVIEKRVVLPHNCPFGGDAEATGALSFSVTTRCRGRLSVYMDLGGVGAWQFRDCETTYRGIRGGKVSETSGELEDVDVEVLFCIFEGAANLCDFQVCAKTNSFSFLLNESKMKKQTHVNRRLSTDGEQKCRFLAAADSREESVRWCDAINSGHQSFLEWSRPLKLF